MMADQLIPKPTLWAFAYFSQLQGDAVYRGDAALVTKRGDGGYEAILWNDQESKEDIDFTLSVPGAGDWTVWTETVDENTCNPLRAWHRMGEPFDLTDEQLQFLRQCAQPLHQTMVPDCKDGKITVHVRLDKNALMRIRFLPVEKQDDPGYDYSYYCKE